MFFASYPDTYIYTQLTSSFSFCQNDDARMSHSEKALYFMFVFLGRKKVNAKKGERKKR
jgi:hypothetical protein